MRKVWNIQQIMLGQLTIRTGKHKLYLCTKSVSDWFNTNAKSKG